MAEWIVTNLEECTDVLGDGLHGTPKYTENGEYAFVNGNNLVDGEILIKKETKRVDYSQYEKYKKPLTDRTIFVSINGTLGNVGVYDSEKIILGKSACYFNVKQSVDKDFIYYVVSSPVFRQYLENNATGTTIKNISLKQMREYTFSIPQIDEQKRISSILRMIDEKIKINKAINNNLEQLAALLFDENYSNNNYNISTLEAVATIKYGKGLPTKKLTAQGFPVFGGNGVIGRYTHFMYEEPQVLVSCRGAASGKIMESYPNSFVTNNSLILEWNDYRYYEFYKQFLLANPLNSYATGSAQPQITIDNIKNVPIPYPNYDEISELCLTLKSISSLHYENVIENNKLANLRDTLLPHLMSGEHDVSNIDI